MSSSTDQSKTDEDDLEWEEWNPSTISFYNHMIAGSVAGLVEHISLFPVDTIKTHIQCERCGSISPLKTWNCATKIVGNEGLFRLWRGVTAMFTGCIPGLNWKDFLIIFSDVLFSSCCLLFCIRIDEVVSRCG